MVWRKWLSAFRPSSVAAMEDVVACAVAAGRFSTREEAWPEIIRQTKAKNFLELGVLRGAFAEHLLRHCPDIERYYMLNPWRHLDDWNKSSNNDQPPAPTQTLSMSHNPCAEVLGLRLIKATIPERRQGRRRRDSYGPTCRGGWRCA